MAVAPREGGTAALGADRTNHCISPRRNGRKKRNCHAGPEKCEGETSSPRLLRDGGRYAFVAFFRYYHYRLQKQCPHCRGDAFVQCEEKNRFLPCERRARAYERVERFSHKRIGVRGEPECQGGGASYPCRKREYP